MKQFLYHVTPQENVKSILQNGLKRKSFAISLSEKPYSWYTPGLAIFKVRITGLKHEMSTFLPDSDEVLVWGDIPAERIFLCNASDVIPRKYLQNLRSMDLPQFGKIFYQKQMEKMENDIYQEIVKVGISVDKDKIVKALTNAREFYKEGYEQGQRDAVKHGRWVGLEYDGYADGCPVYDLWECSECGEEVNGEDVPITHPWCHGCGAKMDLEETRNV